MDAATWCRHLVSDSRWVGSGEGGDPNRGTRTCPEFVRNRVGMQNGDLDQIRTEFDGQVRALVPLYDEDV